MAGKLIISSVGLLLLQVFTIINTIDAQSESRPRPSIQDALLSYMCRGTDARICSGNGQCRNGKCSCYTGYSGGLCEIDDLADSSTTTEKEVETAAPPRVTLPPCTQAADENACSEHGVCTNGVCQCEASWSGTRCELSMREGFCKTYQQCAECMALMQMCPSKCTSVAKFYLVFGFTTTTFHRCRQRNSVRNCVYYYQLEREYPDGQKDIAVRACVPEAREPDTLREMTSAQPDTDDGDDNQAGDQEKNKGGPGSGATKHISDVLVVLGVIVLLRG